MDQKEKDATPVQRLLIPKPILYLAKLLDSISPYISMRYGARLFLTPFRYKMPSREKKMFEDSLQEKVYIPKIKKHVVVYTYGNSDQKILLAHGWSGSGTQLSVIAEALLAKGYSTVSFDAPAHGQSPGKLSMMPYFIETIQHLSATKGPFYAAIGHSLGGMSLLRAVKYGLPIERLVIIGTANSITAITRNFMKNMQLSERTGQMMKAYFDEKFGEDLDNYSGSISAKDVHIPTLVIHDQHDVDVHYSAAHEINAVLTKGDLLITEKLGHRKILGDPTVIQQIVEYIQVTSNC